MVNLFRMKYILLAAKVKTRWTSIAANQISSFLTSIARIMIVTSSGSLVVRMRRFWSCHWFRCLILRWFNQFLNNLQIKSATLSTINSQHTNSINLHASIHRSSPNHNPPSTYQFCPFLLFLESPNIPKAT